MSVLACAGLTVALGGAPVLRGIDLAFEPGRVTAVIGPNGAGKSTLLACLAGLRKPDAGAVALGGAALAGMAPRMLAQRLAVLPQTPEIAWAVDVRTLVGLGRIPFDGARGSGADGRAAVDRAMAAAGVAGFADRIVTSLSGGERARVLIARALAGEPEWLLADEPLTGLDPGHQIDAAALLRALAARGAGVVVTLHDLNMAVRIADRVVVLAAGAAIADGAPADALSPGVLRAAYGIDAEIVVATAGPVIAVTGRSPP